MMSHDQFQASPAFNQPPQVLGCNTISANDHAPDPDPQYIVQHLLFPGQVSMFAGPSNLGKSAIIASIAAHVAMGRDICGMRVSRSAILYIAAEAPKGVLNRAFPYLSQTAAQTAPAARRAAGSEAGFIAVSGSSCTRPWLGATDSMRSI